LVEKVVITGGSGFIMSHVAERLADMDKELVLFDNNAEHEWYEETRQLLNTHKNVRFVRGDVRDREAVFDVVKGSHTVYHFAAVMGTSARFHQETLTIEVNVIGTLNVMDAALDAGVKYYVHPPRPPLTQWLTPYIISKIAQSQFTEMYHRTYGLPTVGLMIANCYGPRERSVLNPNTLRPHEGQKLVATCIIAALKNEPLPIFGDGTQSSDFVFIDDVVDAILKCTTPAAIGQIMDIGTGIATSVNRVAELAIKLTGSKSKIEYLPMRTGEVKLSTRSDITQAKERLGWGPKVDLHEGLRRTIPYYAQQLGILAPRKWDTQGKKT
jgi:UDP-glucose 4-epimerase